MRDDFRSRYEPRDQTSSAVETIAGASEVDRAIAKLVLAFGTDPVARWIYDDPQEYLLTSLDCSEPSEQARLKQGRRNALATARASRFGFHRAFAAMMARSRPPLLKALLVKGKPMSAVPSR